MVVIERRTLVPRRENRPVDECAQRPTRDRITASGQREWHGNATAEVARNVTVAIVREFCKKDRLIGLVSNGDLVKSHIADIEMEASATREYTALASAG